MAQRGAEAAPAEIVLLIDTSRSMAQPVPGFRGRSKLALAKAWAGQIARAAEKAGHRVGLFRFRQRDVLVKTGTGSQMMVAEDRDQCSLMGDMLVGVDAGTSGAIGAWLDGVKGTGQPELTALGHSPLLGSIRLILRYLRGRRMVDPQNNCVNAWIIVFTDGADTCTSGGSRHQALKELKQLSHKEDIRSLVLSFGKGPVVEAIARMGRETPSTARVFGPKDAKALIQQSARIEGRIAPEACLLSGVKARSIGKGPKAPPATPAAPPSAQGCKGCQGTPTPGSGSGWWALWGLLLLGWRSRRWRTLALVGLLLPALWGCKQAPKAPAPVPVAKAPPAPPLEDPQLRTKRALKLQKKLIDAGEKARRSLLEPALKASSIFAGLKPTGAPQAVARACLGLVHSMGYEPYGGIQRGVDGCLATRRCNGLDRALVLKACLEHHKQRATVELCPVTAALRKRLLEHASRRPWPRKLPQAKAFYEAIERAFTTHLKPTDEQRAQLQRAAQKMSQVSGKGLLQNVRQSAKKLRKQGPVDGPKSLAWVRRQVARGVRTHAVVKTSFGRFDPVFAKAPACRGRALDEARMSYGVRAELRVRYRIQGRWQRKQISLGQVIWKPHRHGLRPLVLALVDAKRPAKMPQGLPKAPTSGCLRGLFQLGGKVVATKAFPLTTADASACGDNAIAAVPGMSFVSISLHTSLGLMGRWRRPIERTLLDRFGYVRDVSGGVRSGPMYSAQVARKRLAMRVELWAGGGLPGEAFLHHQMFRSLWLRRAAWQRQLARQSGGSPPKLRSPRPRPLVWQTLTFASHAARALLPRGFWSLQPQPWRMATIMRRGFQVGKKGLTLVPQTLFDILDWPWWVLPPSGPGTAAVAEARLQANLALGVLLTEVERLAGFVHSSSGRVVNAAAMFRDRRTGPWGLYSRLPRAHSKRLPHSVHAAARARRFLGEKLLMTRGFVPFLGAKHLAWWRIHPLSGMALGEIRFDGTFYGGIAAMKAISTLNECLATQAILALRGVRLQPDVKCCMKLAAKMWLTEKGMALLGGWLDILSSPVKSAGKKALKAAARRYRKQVSAIHAARVTRFMAGVRIGERLFRAAYKFNDLYGKAEGAKKLYNMIYGDGSEAPPCVHIIPTKRAAPPPR